MPERVRGFPVVCVHVLCHRFDKEAIIAEMSRLRSTNVDMHNGKGFAYVYDTTQKDFTEALDRVWTG